MDISGVWQGEIRVIPCFPGVPAEIGRCEAVNRITFSLHQSDSAVTGDYRCAIGTLVCRDANTTDRGTLMDGWVSGRNVTLRVMLPGDLSSCLYNGLDSSTEIRGGYRCYQGGDWLKWGNGVCVAGPAGNIALNRSDVRRVIAIGANGNGLRTLRMEKPRSLSVGEWWRSRHPGGGA